MHAGDDTALAKFGGRRQQFGKALRRSIGISDGGEIGGIGVPARETAILAATAGFTHIFQCRHDDTGIAVIVFE
ncbi:hypothetical protein D3C72_2266270 [compost metagenome]